MKFLCVECDEAMSLEETRGPDKGSMSVIFACPSCGRKTAMLTNAMETQVVRSLGVKIGGRTIPSAPMEMIRGSLVSDRRREVSPGGEGGHLSNDAQDASKCPFTGLVNDAYRRDEAFPWSDAARARIERIPEYARRMVVKGVEEAAREQGLDEVTESVLDEVRGRLGM